MKYFNKLLLPNYSLIEILLLSLPIAFLVGPIALEILLFFFFIFFCYRHKNIFYIFSDKRIIILIFFYLVCVLSSVFSDNFLYSLKKSLPFFRSIIFIVIIIYLFENNKKIKNHFYYFLLIILSLISVDSYIQLFFGNNILGFDKIDPKRLSGIFQDEFILGTYLLYFSIVLFWLSNSQRKFENSSIFFLILIEPLIFFSGQRVVFFSSILLIFGLLIFFYKNKLFNICLIISLAIILSNIFLNNKYNERYINDVKANLSYSNSFNVQLNDNLKNNKENKINFSVFSPSHTGLYFTGIKMFIDKPITGHGFRMFRISCKNYKEAKNNCSTHPHNWYIEIISETGIINFFIIFSLFIYLIFLVINNFHWFYNKKNYSQNLYIISLGLLILYNPLRPSGSFFNNFNMILNSLLFALFLIQLRIDKK